MPQEVIFKYILHPFHSDTLIDETKLQNLVKSLLKEGIRYREENMVRITVASYNRTLPMLSDSHILRKAMLVSSFITVLRLIKTNC